MPVAATLSRADALIRTTQLLGSQVEAELLLGHVLGCTRTELYGALRHSIDGGYLARFDEMVRRRKAGEPLQYITGVQEFRNLALRVGPGVLVPRPETELVVEQCLTLLGGVRDPRVIDVGTGSGAIALSLATERPDARVWATDISEAALGWARMNLADAANIELFRGDLFSPLPAELLGTIDLVVSNPPYLSESELAQTASDVRDREPQVALSCAQNGLEVTARLIEEAFDWLSPGGWVVFETSPSLAEEAGRRLGLRYEEVATLEDLAGRRRIVRGRRP